MSLSDLAALGSFVSGLAVLVSLVFLTLQMRQAARNQRSAIHNERTAMVNELLLVEAQGELADVWFRGGAGDATLNAAERQKYLLLHRANTFLFEEIFYQHKDGMLDEKRWAQTVQRLRFVMQLPGWRAACRVNKSVLNDDFAEWFESVLAETPVRTTPALHLDSWAEFAKQELVLAPSTARPA
jgi:hypothetical protein